MLTIHSTDRQAATIVQVMHAVATAQGTMALEPIERDSIDAIQCHLLHRATPLRPAAETLPDDLASVIVDPAMRLRVVRILTLLPLIDKRILPAKAEVVERAAACLGIEDRGLEVLRLAVRRRFRRIAFSTMMRSIPVYWSPTGKARLQDWLDVLRIFLPPVPGLYSLQENRKVLAKYRGLAALPADTLGHALHRFYSGHGFALPGEPKSFPEGFTKHEIYHVISEYETNDAGEMLLAAFCGGNTERLGMDLLMITLLQFQAGIRVVPGPTPVDGLQPWAFFRAMARGSAMTVDLLAGWDMWQVVDRPIDEVRASYRIPPLSAEERTELKGWDALIA